jgi:hypothetical protein
MALARYEHWLWRPRDKYRLNLQGACHPAAMRPVSEQAFSYAAPSKMILNAPGFDWTDIGDMS